MALAFLPDYHARRGAIRMLTAQGWTLFDDSALISPDDRYRATVTMVGGDIAPARHTMITFDDPEKSRLLLKPSGQHHGGGPLPITGFDLAGNRANYDLFLNWILEGARE